MVATPLIESVGLAASGIVAVSIIAAGVTIGSRKQMRQTITDQDDTIERQQSQIERQQSQIDRQQRTIEGLEGRVDELNRTILQLLTQLIAESRGWTDKDDAA